MTHPGFPPPLSRRCHEDFASTVASVRDKVDGALLDIDTVLAGDDRDRPAAVGVTAGC